ncbi:MAG: hypothetical protein Q4G42_02070 [Neisseria sp.]|nr:hypothetical protein [Neisseria sp.]
MIAPVMAYRGQFTVTAKKKKVQAACKNVSGSLKADYVVIILLFRLTR